jgi:hypothetical protein
VTTEREIGRKYGFASLIHFTIGTEHIPPSLKPGEAPKKSEKYGYHQFGKLSEVHMNAVPSD